MAIMLRKILKSIAFRNRGELSLWAMIVCVSLYLLYATFLLNPKSFQYFSLIDDGQSLQNYYSISECFSFKGCDKAKDVFIEKEFGRFRPGYWIMNSAMFWIGQTNPVNIHVFRILALGSILCVLLALAIYRISSSFLGSIVGTSLFFANISFAENMIRIGPAEPFQLILLGIFSLIFLDSQKLMKKFGENTIGILLCLLLCLLCLAKETTVSLAPVLAFFWFFYRSKFKPKYWVMLFFPFLIVVFGKIISKPDANATQYGSLYTFQLSIILRGIVGYWHILVDSIKWYLPVVISLFALVLSKKLPLKDKFPIMAYWVLFTGSFFAILLPWQFVLERYFLVTLFGLAVLVGSSFGILFQVLLKVLRLGLEKIHKGEYFELAAFSSFCFAILASANIFFMSLSLQIPRSRNYALWYAEYLTYESSLVKAVASAAKPVYLNAVPTIDNWEVSFELPLHLQYFYGQKDKIASAKSRFNKGDLVLSSSSLIPDPNISEQLSSGSAVLAQQTFTAPQLDLLKFRLGLRYRPLQTILEPSLAKEGIVHSWKLSEITTE